MDDEPSGRLGKDFIVDLPATPCGARRRRVYALDGMETIVLTGERPDDLD
jgi:hypothetical protein